MFLQFVYKPKILTSTNNSTKNQRTNKHTKKQRFVGGLQFTTNLKHITYVNFFQVIWALKSGDFMCMNVHIGFKGSLSHLRGVFLENSNFLILWHCLMLFFLKSKTNYCTVVLCKLEHTHIFSSALVNFFLDGLNLQKGFLGCHTEHKQKSLYKKESLIKRFRKLHSSLLSLDTLEIR